MTGSLFVNEIHYDNVGEDQDEGVEVAGPAGVDLSGYTIELYSGYDRKMYATIALSGILPDQEGGYGTSFFAAPGMQNGAPDGLALVGPEGVQETLGYEGSFTAIDGSAAGQFFGDIHQFEAPSTPIGQSLQLQGTGSTAADFTWHGPVSATPGQVNTGQHFASVAPAAPVNTAPPTISGTPNVGETLSCSSGSWDNNPTSYSYEWDQDGIPLGAFSETYAVEGPSANHSLTCTVTAFNAAGSASATSSVVEVSAAPVNTAPPTISGTPNVGETLSCSSGSWDNNPTSYSYEWDQDGIPLGAFSETYAVEGPSANHSLTCTVTAFNAAGSASATSSVVEVSAAPVNTAPPTISGTPNVGETLSCSSGSWDNNPTSYSYEWDQDGIPLGAFSETYAVEGPSANHSLTCTVTAFNAAPSASARARSSKSAPRP